jgi:hypothetical protein
MEYYTVMADSNILHTITRRKATGLLKRYYSMKDGRWDKSDRKTGKKT